LKTSVGTVGIVGYICLSLPFPCFLGGAGAAVGTSRDRSRCRHRRRAKVSVGSVGSVGKQCRHFLPNCQSLGLPCWDVVGTAVVAGPDLLLLTSSVVSAVGLAVAWYYYQAQALAGEAVGAEAKLRVTELFAFRFIFQTIVVY
jgi:hypothetical protein